MRLLRVLRRSRRTPAAPDRGVAGEPHSWFVGKSHITTGRFTYHGGIKIHQWNEGAKLTFGQFCSVATVLTVMLGGNHRTDWSTTFPFGHIHTELLGGTEIAGHPVTRGDVIIGNDVWLGMDVTLMSGISIGDGAVIAAKSVVSRSVGAYEVWGGNPARRLGDRFTDEIKAMLLDLRWWDLTVKEIRQLAHLLSQPPTREILEDAMAIARSDAVGREGDPEQTGSHENSGCIELVSGGRSYRGNANN